jgi:hypothetical protein
MADRAEVEIVDARAPDGSRLTQVIGERVGMSYRDMRPLVDHWASSPRALGRHALPASQRSRLKPNPVPPPPVDKRAQTFWVERTFPVGTVMKLERGKRIKTADAAWWEKEEPRLAKHPLLSPAGHTLRWPAGTRAEVVYRETKLPPFLLRAAPLSYVVARLLPPPGGAPTAAEPYVGAAVRNRRAIDRYPAARIRAGHTGLVTYINRSDDPFAEVQIRERVPGLDEWDNSVQYSPDSETWQEFVDDWEVIDPWEAWREHLEQIGLDPDDDTYIILQTPEDFVHVKAGHGNATAIWMPTTDTWGAPPAPIPRYRLPKSQRSWLRPNADKDMHENPIPPPPQNRMDWWSWAQRTFPEGTPVVFTEEFQVDPYPIPAGARAIVQEHHHSRSPAITVRLVAPIPGTSDPELVRLDDHMRRSGFARGVEDWDIWVNTTELAKDQVLRPLVDTWGSGGGALGRHALPRSQRARLKPNAMAEENPVPAPPSSYKRQTEWVERTFPVGTPMRLEHPDVFVALSEDGVREAMSKGWSLATVPKAAVRLPAGTRAHVVAVHDLGPSGSSLGARVGVVVAEVPEPPVGLIGVDAELDDAFAQWRHIHPRGPMLLALNAPADFIRIPSPSAGRSRDAAVWWPLMDTWGDGSRARGRHHLPRSQRSPYRPNPDLDDDDDIEEDDEDELEHFIIHYDNGDTEEVQATDLDDAWDWGEAYADGREVASVELDDEED